MPGQQIIGYGLEKVSAEQPPVCVSSAVIGRSALLCAYYHLLHKEPRSGVTQASRQYKAAARQYCF